MLEKKQKKNEGLGGGVAQQSHFEALGEFEIFTRSARDGAVIAALRLFYKKPHM